MLVSETREKTGRLIVGIVFKVSFTPFESSLRYIFLSPVLTLTLVSSLVPSLFQCYPRKILSTLPNEIYFFPLFLNFRFYSFVDSPSRFLVSGMVTRGWRENTRETVAAPRPPVGQIDTTTSRRIYLHRSSSTKEIRRNIVEFLTRAFQHFHLVAA